MSVGQGLAIIGVWLFPCACAFSKWVSSKGWVQSIYVAIVMTLWLNSCQP